MVSISCKRAIHHLYFSLILVGASKIVPSAWNLLSADVALDNLALDSYIWVVDISGKDGNLMFDLSKGNQFTFSIQSGPSPANSTGRFQSIAFTIADGPASSNMPPTPSSASIPNADTIMAISVGLVMFTVICS